MPEIREFMKQFYILDDWVRQFLIVGEEVALPIDTGVEESHVAEGSAADHQPAGAGGAYPWRP